LDRQVLQGPAAKVLLDAGHDADMIVVGSRGRGGFAGLLLGSVSQQVAQHAPLPVVIVPHER
jgi:nucleotide-binding universal stress UspA family protein